MKSTLFNRAGRTLAGIALMASALVVGVTVPSSQVAVAGSVIAQKVAVPAYINPLLDPNAWAQLATSSPASMGFAVANVINGPDYTPFDEWSQVIQSVSASGVKVVGYVDTGYLGTTGQRTRLGSTDPVDWMSQIQHDVDTWYRFYGSSLSGIFFDQTQNACGPTQGSNAWADQYQRLSDNVERLYPGSVTVLNPGIAVPQCYETASDVIVTFEGSYASYVGDPSAANPYTPLSWTPVDPQKIWHIVYDAPDVTTMANTVALSETRGAGYIYVTDDVMANPYDTLPPVDYWAAELAAVLSLPDLKKLPNTPSSLDTVEVWATSVQLDWWVGSRRAPAVAYDIYRDGVLLDSVPATSLTYTAVDLTPLTAYTFTVVARDALGRVSRPSNALTVYTDETFGDPRRPPVLFAPADTTYTSTRLTWQPAVQRDGVVRPDIAAYVVQQNGREILRLPAWATSVTIGALAPGSTYSFSVYSIDASGERTGDSHPVRVTTQVLPYGATIGATSVVESPEQFVYGADFLVPVAFRRVFIETANPANPCWSTGSTPQMCADYVIENERLLRYTGNGFDWNWDVVADVVPAVTGTAYSWTISPADIGSPVTAVAVFNANGYAPNSYCGVNFVCTTSGPPLPYE